MSPHRSNQRGSLVLDRRYPPPIGRLRCATKLTDPDELAVFLDRMLPALAEQGAAMDVLLAIKQKRVTVKDALALWRGNRLHEIARAKAMPVLSEAMLAYAGERKADDADREHARKMGTTARHILRLAPGMKVQQIGDVLPILKADLTPSAFNQARAHLMAFARDVLGRSSTQYAAIRDTRRRKKGKREKGRPYSPAEIRGAAAKLTPAEAGMLWTLCTTGMGEKEYWERGEAHWITGADRIHIGGTKNAKRDRDVPLVVPPTRPVCGKRKFGRRLKEVGIHDGTVLYNTRRAFSRALAEARIVLVNQKAYMGHSVTITELYQMGEIEGQLAADAAAMARYFGFDTRPVRALEVMR